MRGGGEGGNGNSGGWVLRLSLQGLKKGRELSKLKRCKQEVRQIQILGILWLNNNWMSPAQKFMTKPQFISVCWKEFHLVHIKSQKLNAKNPGWLDNGGREHSVHWGTNPQPPLKTSPPLFRQAPFKSANCPSGRFLGTSPYILLFCEPLLKIRFFSEHP